MAARLKARDDTTPLGNLEEAGMHEVIGYQIAQASIATLGWFHAMVGEPLQLTPVEYTLLTLVNANPGVSGARLARALAVTAPNIVQRISRLEARGLVQRETSTTDRRVQRIKATAKGRQLSDKATRLLQQGDGEVFDNLTEIERRILVSLLHKVATRRAEGAARADWAAQGLRAA